MGDFYADARAMASELLAPTDEDGLGQGDIRIVRYAAPLAAPNAWSAPSPPLRTTYQLSGAARGVGKELIGAPVENGGQIVATDLQVIVSVWDGKYEPGDVLEIDCKPVTVLKIENIPAAGPPCAIRFLVRR